MKSPRIAELAATPENIGALVWLALFGRFALVLLLIQSGVVFGADCTWLTKQAAYDPTANYYYNGGTTNPAISQAVRAVLRFSDCTVSGTWFDSTSFTDVEVKGLVSPDGSIALKLIGKKGALYATFRGRFFDLNFFLSKSLLTKPAMDRLIGQFTGAGKTIGPMVQLHLSRWWNKDYADAAETSGTHNLTEFNHATLRFWRAVRSHDVSTVARCIHYPLQAYIFDSKDGTSTHVVIKNAQAMERDYDKIFNWFLRGNILSHLPRHMSPTEDGHGFMLGGGVVTFNSYGQVTSVGW